ncbi:MAG: hypothetical protein WBN07_08045 [Woeseiaceae bacterium]
MKGLVVIAAALLVGCAPTKTLEELEFAALASGDWSAVEKREQNIERRKRERSVSCGSDSVPVCNERARGLVCKCWSQQDLAEWMGAL